MQYVRGRGNTILPVGGAHLYKTWQVAAPRATHFRRATCEEVGCLNHHHGWKTVVDETTDLGQRQAHYIRRESRRRYVEERTPAGTVFTFEAGQVCFNAGQHVVSLERPFLYVVRDGDWRGNPRGTPARRHANPHDWADECAEHMDRLDRAVNG